MSDTLLPHLADRFESGGIPADIAKSCVEDLRRATAESAETFVF